MRIVIRAQEHCIFQKSGGTPIEEKTDQTDHKRGVQSLVKDVYPFSLVELASQNYPNSKNVHRIFPLEDAFTNLQDGYFRVFGNPAAVSFR